MLDRRSVGAIALAAVLSMATVGAWAHDEAKYPDWKGQWSRIGGVQWDPSKPRLRQQAPLTAEYQAILEANLADLATGGHANNPTYTCKPPGMPRVMTLVEPMEAIITPDMTYMRIEYMNTLRRIHTDGRDWPEKIEPTFAGYSIGKWEDTSGNGRYDTLVVDTRGLKGHRFLDSSGMPLHRDNRTVVKERIYLDKADRDILHNDITTIDDALSRPWTVNRTYRRNRSPNWVDFVCAENNREVIIGNEGYFLSADGYLMPTKKDQPPPDLRYFPKQQ